MTQELRKIIMCDSFAAAVAAAVLSAPLTPTAKITSDSEEARHCIETARNMVMVSKQPDS